MTQQDKEETPPKTNEQGLYVHGSIYDDPFIHSFLKKLPKEVAVSFTDLQLLQIKLHFGTRTKAKHVMDVRSMIGIGEWRYYWVLLLGRNRRDVPRVQAAWFKKGRKLIFILGVSFLVFMVFISLYLLKSFLGIDIFPRFSLGLWSWFSS